MPDKKDEKKPGCPYCGAVMKKWKVPGDSTWIEEFHWVCFNDECEYYQQGWDWMLTRYQQHASYRCRMSPSDMRPMPLPVWSPSAHREYILDDEENE
ncbi:MAG: ogr/Delta-like zinc finger family protein [bacterium]